METNSYFLSSLFIEVIDYIIFKTQKEFAYLIVLNLFCFTGTIAEREHKKWLNAVPLKNNPYSAENISKRSPFSKKAVLNEHISSFEEFERKLSVSSVSSEPPLNKLNCGPKSIDSELYKRDYYINQDYEPQNDNFPLKKSSKHTYSFSDDSFDATAEEALNSFEEKVIFLSIFSPTHHLFLNI